MAHDHWQMKSGPEVALHDQREHEDPNHREHDGKLRYGADQQEDPRRDARLGGTAHITLCQVLVDCGPDHLLMDRAYEGDETRQLALDLGFVPVVPPKQTRVTAWEYNRAMCKRRNEIERLFRRLKGFRRIFSRFEKLDVMFVAFINFALIVDGLR